MRPDCIKHYSEIQQEAKAYYPESTETFSLGSPFARTFGLQKLGIHHEVLPPGKRTSWPHAEADEEEFIYVIEGTPDVWIDGHLHRLRAGDGVGFPSGTGISHTFINNTDKEVRLLVVGEPSKPEGRVFYPLNESRKKFLGSRWWADVPKQALGNHDGNAD